MAAVVLGGVTWISSSGMIAKVLTELNRLQSLETPVVLSILVLEDLAMAVYLPLAAALLLVGGPAKVVLLVSIAIVTSLLSSAWPSAMDRRSAAWPHMSQMRLIY
jgi:monovalent cation:H+ antiporter-2, CPA2 family